MSDKGEDDVGRFSVEFEIANNDDVVDARRGHLKSSQIRRTRTTALIGAIVLETLDFVVDCTIQKLLPRDPKPIVSEAE